MNTMTRDWRPRGNGMECLVNASGGAPCSLTAYDTTATHLELGVTWQKEYYVGKPRGFYFQASAVGLTRTGRVYSSAWGLESVLVEEGKRFNAKRARALLPQVEASIERRQGPIWEAIEKVLVEHRFTWPAEEPVGVAA